MQASGRVTVQDETESFRETGMADAAKELEQLNPRTAWQPFTPTRRSRWDAVKAAHLLRRASFGASWKQIEEAVATGPTAVIDRLCEGGPELLAFDADAAELTSGAIMTGEPQQLEAAWMHRLLNSPHPLRERLTLFWHDHFATSLAKVEDLQVMQRQNDTLRKNALGHFPEILHAMTRDPAMLIWLDSNSNRKGSPNENYAREVFELFSLGLGNYTEQDIKEAARALTGWSVRERDAFFDPAQHDETEKTIFGQRGPLTSGDVVRLCLSQPACSQFLVRKLFQEFISDAATPSDELIEPLAQEFRQRDYDIKWLVRTMLGSWAFFSEAAIQQRVKSPVEFIVGTVKTLEGRISPTQAATACADIGQRLFFPPSVKGWDGGRLWLNSTTVMRRQNAAFDFTRGIGDRSRCDPAHVAAEYGASDIPAMTDFFLNLFHQRTNHPQRTDMIRQLEEESAKIGGGVLNQRARTAQLARLAAHLVMTLPEYQLG